MIVTTFNVGVGINSNGIFLSHLLIRSNGKGSAAMCDERERSSDEGQLGTLTKDNVEESETQNLGSAK